MNRLVALFISTRRTARHVLPLAICCALAAVIFVHAAWQLDQRLFAGFILGVLTLIGWRAWRHTNAVSQSWTRDLELGALLAIAGYATTIYVDGDLDGSYFPLVFVAVGVMSSFARPAASLTVIAAMIGFEACLRRFAYEALDIQQLLPHLGFAIVFGLLNTVSLRMEVARLRKASRSELDADRERLRVEARSYRLLRAPGDDDCSQRDEERLLHSAVEEVQLSVLYALQLLRQCLDLHSTMLLWLNDDELRISELVSESSELCEGPFSPRDGILGAVLTQQAAVCVAQLKPGYLLPYYQGASPVRSVCAIPVFEQNTIRGILIADRKQPEPFSPEEQRLVEHAARFAARVVENERVFVQLERTKVEQGRLYRAAQRLGEAVSEEAVITAGVDSASEITAVDFAAFTSYDADTDTHQITAVRGEVAEALEGQGFAGNHGLVSMALRNQHSLPYRGQYDSNQQTVFGAKLSAPDVPSLLVLPLIVHDKPLGTLVLGSEQPWAFGDAVRATLEVLASHMAVSLANARMVLHLEEKATTDGMTGLLNKRALLETADEKMRAAKRFGRRLSVLVADIDLFKNVNDTYGHDVGDIVIKELAQIHQRNKRDTDSVARFGGEEFVTICEETDAEGALLLAERIRDELGRTTFHAGSEEFKCTCSIGIATFPEAGPSWQELFKAADQALYVSKRGGRDRTTIHDPSRSDAA